MSPHVSIIVCTRDRAARLAETLASIALCTIPEGWQCELLVVDNGSSDHTRDVACSAECAEVPVRYVSERRQGKGFAYNAGIDAAQGSVLLFTDDDVSPPPEWVRAMVAPIAAGEVDLLAGGVRIGPGLDRPWLTGALRTMYALTDGSPQTRPMILGANMAVSRKVFEVIDSFDPALGPGGLGGGEEVLFYIQVLEAGFRVACATGGDVEHRFDGARLCRRKALETAAAYGRSDAYIHHHWIHGNPRLLEARLLKEALALTLRRALRRPWRSPDACQEWEALAVNRFHRLAHLRRLRDVPYNYERRGFRRIAGAAVGA